MKKNKTIILGAGMTGLAAGFVSGAPVYEARESPGGICSSYYLRPFTTKKLARRPKDGDVYRFEVGGGHWIFGGDPLVRQMIERITPCDWYERKASIYLPDRDLFVPYPFQQNISHLSKKEQLSARNEMGRGGDVRTMREWLLGQFGETLCNLFFFPFHELYTAGLYHTIAPQDGYKSPAPFSGSKGYNTRFFYPREGLDALARGLAKRCDIRYGKKVVRIDTRKKRVFFLDGSFVDYGTLISTLPLNQAINITGIEIDEKQNPSPAVLVVNVGALKGSRCPRDQWVYIPRSRSGFHRVGFYSNVDESFLPNASRGKNKKDRVGIYIEKAYPEGCEPSKEEVGQFMKDALSELTEWGWIGEIEVADATWISVAYTWSWPDSTWRERAICELESRDIYPVGRYARWIFQGIADSIRDGLISGGAIGRS